MREEVGMGKVAKVPVALVVVRMGGDPLLEVFLHLSYYPAHAALGGEYTNLAFFLLFGGQIDALFCFWVSNSQLVVCWDGWVLIF